MPKDHFQKLPITLEEKKVLVDNVSEWKQYRHLLNSRL